MLCDCDKQRPVFMQIYLDPLKRACCEQNKNKTLFVVKWVFAMQQRM